MTSHHLILVGHINCILSPSLDRSSSKKTSLSRSVDTIQLFLKTYGFHNPNSRAYSFFSPVHQSYSCIDIFFLDKRIISSVNKCDCEAIGISDHGPLIMKIHVPNTQNSYCPWSFNPLLLSEKSFTNFISSEIKFFLDANQHPAQLYGNL